MFSSAGCSLLMAQSLSCSLDPAFYLNADTDLDQTFELSFKFEFRVEFLQEKYTSEGKR
jgi:hypothetical protein